MGKKNTDSKEALRGLAGMTGGADKGDEPKKLGRPRNGRVVKGYYAVTELTASLLDTVTLIEGRPKAAIIDEALQHYFRHLEKGYGQSIDEEYITRRKARGARQ